MDAFTLLRNDHESVLGMFEVLDGAPQGSGAQLSGLGTMVTDLVVAESRHEAIEQQHFWPLVRETLEDGDRLADDAMAQENSGKHLLQKLENGKPGEPEYHGALAAFIEAGRRHIAYEQNVVWPRLAAALNESQLQELGATLARAKEKAPTRPHPDTPSGPGAQKTMGAAAATLDKLRDAVTGRENPPDPPAP
ncbi:hemerythrin domain-containing protein [Rhodococcus phenolicus]|uniref:hemerythrin domain-containing protein n=1 Tax=Rhodococcus phenolicus TaxID=263849 RepID=UPI000829F692|nr:hemerythrin domain-containing protein [Rhodococcus phenolicus]